MVDSQRALEKKWSTLRFGEVNVETKGEQHVFEIQIHLNDLAPDAVRVELYANGDMGRTPALQEMKLDGQPGGAAGGYVYSATVPAARPRADYTVRIIPRCDGVAIPLEDGRILWQR